MSTLQGAASPAIRRVVDSVFQGKAYRWVETPDPFATVRRWWRAIGQWLRLLAENDPILYRLLLFALTGILVGILVHAAWIFVRSMRARALQPVSQTPQHIRRDEEWYRREAARLAAAGQYIESMQAEFLALVLALDRARLLRFHPSKTPAEYLAEASLTPGAREEFRSLVRGLYGYAFARWPCDAETLADWRTRAAPERYAPAR